MRTSVLFNAKIIVYLFMMCPHGQGEGASVDKGVIFHDFVRTSFMDHL